MYMHIHVWYVSNSVCVCVCVDVGVCEYVCICMVRPEVDSSIFADHSSSYFGDSILLNLDLIN